ncbi:4316_t:CDS:2, partial [Cetraspora pellucida]
ANNRIYDERENNKHEDSKNEDKEKNNLLVLRKEMKFIVNSDDYTITRWRTYECSHAQIHEPEKAILAEDRRDRDSEMIDCPWHINLAFSKTEKEVHINSILDKLNRTSQLTDVVGEIQTIFNQQSKKAILAKCKNKIPIKDQMAQSICYDTVLVENWLALLESHSPKQRYGFGIGYVKKILDLAIRANKVDDFVNKIECFIEKTKRDMFDQNKNVNLTNVEDVSVRDLLRVQHKGRQPKRYKSGDKLLKKITGNKKGE